MFYEYVLHKFKLNIFLLIYTNLQTLNTGQPTKSSVISCQLLLVEARHPLELNLAAVIDHQGLVEKIKNMTMQDLSCIISSKFLVCLLPLNIILGRFSCLHHRPATGTSTLVGQELK